MDKKYSRETLCVQAGWTPKKGEPRVLPIYQSTTFKYDTSEQMARLFDLEDSGYFYTRLQNPTNDAVAAKIAALEGGVGAMLTSSGQAANFYAIFNICQAGDHFVCSSTIYGGTFNLFGVTLKKLRSTWVRTTLAFHTHIAITMERMMLVTLDSKSPTKVIATRNGGNAIKILDTTSNTRSTIPPR